MISIIIPMYNSENTILDAINSVINQTFDDWEIIIVDDLSTDNSVHIVESVNNNKIKLIKSKFKLGAANARNIAISLARGDCICFLDSDDLWEPTKLEKQYNLISSGWDVVCSNYSTFLITPQDIINTRKSPEIIRYKDMLKSNFIGNLTGIYNSKKIGKIYQVKSGHEDYIMWLKILKIAQRAYCIQEPLAKYRLSNNSLSANKLRSAMWQWSIYRNELNLSLLKSLYYFIHYIFNALKKRR